MGFNLAFKGLIVLFSEKKKGPGLPTFT